MSTAVDTYVLTIEDEQYPVIVESAEAERLLQSRGATADRVPARVSLRDTGDTEGHQLASFVAVDLRIDGDVEGHAFTLRFPSTEAARDFQKRLLATGAVLGVLAAGAVGLGVGQGLGQATAQSQAAPIVTTPATRDMDKELAPIAQVVPGDTSSIERGYTPSSLALQEAAESSRAIARGALAPATEATPRDMDKELAPSVTVAPRDMDKELAPPVTTTQRTVHRGAVPE